MSETPFFQTAMGRTYYERTLPALVQELGRLREAVAELTQRLPPAPTSATKPRQARNEAP